MIPRTRELDSTIGFLKDGYLFGRRRLDRVGGNAFRGRLMGRPVVFGQGVDAARFFYEGGRFGRKNAMPRSVMHLLQDEGSVQSLEGEAHRDRKAFFIDVSSSDDSRDALVAAYRRAWLRSLGEWTAAGRVTLLDASTRVLTRAVLDWAGIEADDASIDLRTEEFGEMVARAGTFGPVNWRARAVRRRSEEWSNGLIEGVRSRADANDSPADAAGTPLAKVALYRDPTTGERLPTEVATVELLNLLRPTVAVARFVVFCALALHRHPAWRERFESGNDDRLRDFANEVRRFYPFFPVIGGTATRDLEWDGSRIRRGQWMMLDLYGTNHSPDIWEAPGRFDPDRFAGVAIEPNTLIPQGGGSAPGGHRCPGEPVTVDLMVETIKLLTRDTVYTVPDQDLRVSLRRFPSSPTDGFVMELGTGSVSDAVTRTAG